jgi:hypothetical protein
MAVRTKILISIRRYEDNLTMLNTFSAWRCLFSGLLRRVVWYKFTEVTEVFATSIIRAIALLSVCVTIGYSEYIWSRTDSIEQIPSWETDSRLAGKDILRYYGTLRFITVFRRAYHWSLFWVRWNQSIIPHPISIKLILILGCPPFTAQFYLFSSIQIFWLKSFIYFVCTVYRLQVL